MARVCEFVLLAEFNILTGSTIKHQFPYPIGVDEQMLAEFMLPDGAHKREDDWTVFFLNRPGQEGVLGDSSKAKPKKKPESLEAFVYRFDQKEAGSGWKLVGPGKRRVALTDPIQIFDGDREIFRISKTEHLELTKMDELFLGVQDSETTAVGMRLSTAEDAAKLTAHVEAMKVRVQELEILLARGVPLPDAQRPFLCCLNLVWNKLDPTVKRGAVVKAMAVCTPHHYIDVFKPFIMLALDRYYKRQSVDVLSDLYFALNAADFTSLVPRVSDFGRLVLRNHRKVKKKVADLTVLMPSDNPDTKTLKMAIHVPLTSFPDEVGDFKVLTILQKFGRHTMTIYNAILAEKRVLFLGFNSPAGDVCNFVLAAVCMVCPPLRGVIQRAFPYSNLTYLDFLSVKGFIAGVSNPVFEERTEWWDVLCNIQTGKVALNPKTCQGFPDPAHAAADTELLDEADFYMQSHFGEDKIRQLFQNYTRHIVAMAFNEEVFPDEASEAREFTRQHGRLGLWRQTTSFRQYEADREELLKSSPLAPAAAEVVQGIRTLKRRKNVPDDIVVHIFELLLQRVNTPAQIEQLVSHLPESEGGLYPIAIGLFHSSAAVRSAAFQLLQRIGKTEAGAPALAGMDLLLAVAYHRILDQPGRASKERSRREMLSMRASQPSKL